MSQATNWAVPTEGPVTPTVMAQRITDSLNAELSAHSGTTAPAYRQIGTRWCDTATANRMIFKIWDGSAWVVYLTIDTGADSARITSINPITTLASAATTTLASVESDSIEITGTAGITSFGSSGPGLIRFVRFAGVLTLTHSAALLLPAATNITTAAGDALIAISLGSGNWRVLSFSPATIRVALPPSRTVTSASSAGDRTFAAADAGKAIVLAGSSNFTMTFEAAATLGNGWSVDVKATTSVLVTLDPNASETIDGSTTLILARGQECRLICDGTQIRTVGLQRRITLSDQITTSAVTAIEFEVPPGYTRFDLQAFVRSTADDTCLIQLSNNGGSSWQTTSYSGGAIGGGSGGAAISAAVATNGFEMIRNGGSTSATQARALIELGDGAAANRMIATSSFVTASAFAFASQSFLNTTFAGVNRMRAIMNSGQIASGARFTLEGIRP